MEHSLLVCIKIVCVCSECVRACANIIWRKRKMKEMVDGGIWEVKDGPSKTHIFDYFKQSGPPPPFTAAYSDDKWLVTRELRSID